MVCDCDVWLQCIMILFGVDNDDADNDVWLCWCMNVMYDDEDVWWW